MPLIRRGAEASLYLEKWYGHEVVMKKRLPKSYRIFQLDSEIRRSRTIRESQLLHDAKLAGVPTPTIFMVDRANTSIIMRYIEGIRVKEALDKMTSKEREKLCRQIGRLIGKLHKRGIVHGDLTSSNIILTRHGQIFFIDFGLGEYSKGVEERGVDLHLLKRAFQSTHYTHAKKCFEAVLEGYTKEMGEAIAREVARRVEEIGKRGRYIPVR